MAFDTASWRSGVRKLAGNLTAAAEEAVNEDRVRVAVTGLSQAGKTVFITSLIHNLLGLGAGHNTLPRILARLNGDGGSRLISINVLPAGAALLPAFDYEAKLAGLAAASPTWPQHTDDLAQISICFELTRKSGISQRLGRRRLRLDLLDYPGEWLLDLPLIDQSFADWSAKTLDLLRQPPRDAASAPFLHFLNNVRADHKAEELIARQGHDLYREALAKCRTRHGLRYLQPGRFLCPGPRSDAPFMWFFPIEIHPGGPASGSLGALLRDRFDAYRQDMRTSFFDTHFAEFDRQVMLVDVLGALAAGQAAFADTRSAVQDIAHALRYGSRPGAAKHFAANVVRGSQSMMLPAVMKRVSENAAQLIDGRRIERVAFVATKADHVPAMKRDNLRNLLRSMADGTVARQRGASVSFRVAASLLATEDGSATMGERTVEVVRGVLMGEDRVRPFYVGEVPSNIPPPSFWKGHYLELPKFRPPPLEPDVRNGLPNLGLDEVLDDLIGELL